MHGSAVGAAAQPLEMKQPYVAVDPTLLLQPMRLSVSAAQEEPAGQPAAAPRRKAGRRERFSDRSTTAARGSVRCRESTHGTFEDKHTSMHAAAARGER